jgi:uncharacterized Ntn-hydrolase superfamily protein
MKTIANGDNLTKESFDDFVSRLHHGVRGDGVNRHHTANAIFIVQQKIRTYGYTEDYSDMRMVYRDDNAWYSIKEFWDALDDDERKELDDIANNMYCSKFMEFDEFIQWNILEDDQNKFTVTRYKEDWEYVNSHLTRDAADAFIKRKKHDYDELRVYVDSQYWCWEFNEIIEAILDGKLVYNEK